MLYHQNDLALHGPYDLDLLSLELWFYYVEVIVYAVIYMNLCLIYDYILIFKWFSIQLHDEPMLYYQNDLALHGPYDLDF